MPIRAEDFLPHFFVENIYWAHNKLETLGEGIGVWCIDTGILGNVPESFGNQVQDMPEILFEAGIIPETYKEIEGSQHTHHVRMNLTKEKYARDIHGTIVASIINEVAPEALIYDIKGASQRVRSADYWLVHAIYACLAIKTHLVENDLKNPPMDIINISLGRYGSTPLERFGFRGCLGHCEMSSMIGDLSKLGVLVICAAGNGGKRSIACPACARDAIAVGSAIRNEDKIVEAAFSSNFPITNKPDILAPTDFAVTTHVHIPLLGHHKHLTLDSFIEGTSFSSPIVSGVSALLLSKMRYYEDDPRSKVDSVKNALTRTARRGHRLRKLLDVKRAVKELSL